MPNTNKDDNMNKKPDNDKSNHFDVDKKSSNVPEWNEDLTNIVVGYH